MSMEMLTPRQKQVYDFVVSWTSEHGFPPTVREICEAVGLSSTATVHSHLKALENKGYLKIAQAKSRAVTVSGPDSDPEAAPETPVELPYSAVQLPLVGQVAAGCPILAEQNIEEEIILPKSIVGDSSSFLLRVKGDSMIEAGILDGDYVVVKEQNSARNGEIVVALLDDSATVKTFYREDGRIRLQPQNSSMEPIYCDDVAILGRVVALFRTL